MKGIYSVCDVCRLLDRDNSLKRGEYCKSCDAFICDDCKYKPIRRAKAALIKLTNNQKQ